MVIYKPITQEYLQSILNYNPGSGILVWKFREDRTPQWNGRYSGMEAGCVTYFERGGPYRVLNIDNKTYLVHRIIWFYYHGYIPDQVDHKDGNGVNNKIINLRDASQTLNNANSNIKVRGTERHGRGFKARIKIKGETIYLGTYDTESEAHTVFKEAHKYRYKQYSRFNREPDIIRRF